MFLERRDGEVRARHERVAYGGDALEEVEGVGGGGTGEGLEEDYAGRGLRARGVETLDAEWHFSFLAGEGGSYLSLWEEGGGG